MKTGRVIQAILFAGCLALFCASSSIAANDSTACYLKREYVELCYQMQDEYNVSAALIAAIIEVESSGNCNAVNGECKGLMQVSEVNNPDNLDLYDPETNVRLGTELLLAYAEKANGDLFLALMYYNGQPDALKRSEENRPTKYVYKVTDLAERIEGEWYGTP